MENDKKIIDLNFELLNNDENNGENAINLSVKLSEIINKNEIIVILGPPGSGKTSILKKYVSENSIDAEHLEVKEFINNIKIPNEKIKILLLDGFDEFRNTENDKTYSIKYLGSKISDFRQNHNTKIVIACRFMDWYGEHDNNNLSAILGTNVSIYKILPLDKNQQNELVTNTKIKDSKLFLEKFNNLGFLENPLLLEMLIELYSKNSNIQISSKNKLYEEFINLIYDSQSKNIIYKIDVKDQQLNKNKILMLGGYLAFFYIFSDEIKIFNDINIKKIGQDNTDYNRNKLELVLKTTLFNEGKFRHRTFAEYLCANFLNTLLNDTTNTISLTRIKNLFVNNGIISTTLRGTFSFLCSIRQDENLIKIDPYYQSINGDCSLFSNNLKKSLILAVKEYSTTIDPYFINYKDIYAKTELNNFYNDNLDDLLETELEYAFKLENHYSDYLIMILVSANEISFRMKGFLKNQLQKDVIADYRVVQILKIFENDFDFLKNILYKVCSNNFDNNNFVKDFILTKLYLNCISSTDIVKYLNTYKAETNHALNCFYLYNTNYDDKYFIVKELCKNIQNMKLSTSLLGDYKGHYSLALFIEDFFYETLINYNNPNYKLNINIIYKMIKEIKEYLPKTYEIKPQPNPYLNKYKNIDRNRVNKIFENVYSKIFSLYVDDYLNNDSYNNYLLHGYFINFISFLLQTQNQDFRPLLIQKINKSNNLKVNSYIFENILYLCSEEELLSKNNEYEKLAIKFNLLNKFNEIIKIKTEQKKIIPNHKNLRIYQDKAENIKINDDFFNKLTDDEILYKHLNKIINFSQFYYFGRVESSPASYSDNIRKRFLSIISKIISNNKIISDYHAFINIDYLSSNINSNMSGLSCLFYLSFKLSKKLKMENLDPQLIKYLYVIHILNTSISGITRNVEIDIFEANNNDFAIDILKDYMILFLQHHLPFINIFTEYIKEIKNIDQLKTLVKIYFDSNRDVNQDTNNIIYHFLQTLNFRIIPDDLERLKNLDLDVRNKNIIQVIILLKQNSKKDLTKKMIVDLFKMLITSDFDYNSLDVLDNTIKIRFIDFLMDMYNTEESIKTKDGTQTPEMECASFINNVLSTNFLSYHELDNLRNERSVKNDIWTNRILHELTEKKRKELDNNINILTISKLKDFVFNSGIVSQLDFFEYVSNLIEELKKTIEENGNNDKEAFYNMNENIVSKHENQCRDILVQRLSSNNTISIERENLKAHKRSDIKIVKNDNNAYSVYIECKKDTNNDLFNGINKQLIKKYLKNRTNYGIYLIFNFGERKSKKFESLNDKLVEKIPEDYKNNIKIIILNLKID